MNPYLAQDKYHDYLEKKHQQKIEDEEFIRETATELFDKHFKGDEEFGLCHALPEEITKNGSIFSPEAIKSWEDYFYSLCVNVAEGILLNRKSDDSIIDYSEVA